jgi:hypothetical protein
MIDSHAHATVVILLPLETATLPAAWTVDRNGHLFRMLDHSREACRMVQTGFELAEQAEACQDPAGKAALLQSAERLVRAGREMLVEHTMVEMPQEVYSGA